MIKAAIFDMDGLLIDSEPVWERVELAAFNKVGLPLTKALHDQMRGMSLNDIVDMLLAKHPNTLIFDKSKFIAEVQHQVNAALADQVELLPGAMETINTCRSVGLLTAIASSSPGMIIRTVTDKFDLATKMNSIHSGYNEKVSKPNPAIFLSTARQLGVQPSDCLVFEDAIAGVQAAKAAGMICVAVPDPTMFDYAEYDIADFKLHSLTEFSALKNRLHLYHI
ncbi:MAG: HAD-IA family hydrolase [Candidatus Nomurabacteria bacterium]|jgi:sugar-phosphatase|nr:HAD-IA family hydrolase [Candidatus Nomurabacteria bacterium]